MVKLSELVNGMAAILKVDARSVSLCARYLREAGLIAQKGRGPSAADMTPRDAVSLLLGLMASPEIKDAPASVKRVRGATFSGRAGGPDVERVGLPDFPWLWRGGKKGARRGDSSPLPLGDVLEAMLAELLRGDLMAPYPEIGRAVPILNWFLAVTHPGDWARLDFGDGSRSYWIEYVSPRRHALEAKTLTPTEVRALIRSARGLSITASLIGEDFCEIADLLKPPKEGNKE